MDFSLLITIIIVCAVISVVLMVLRRSFVIFGVVLLGLFVLGILSGYFVIRDFQDFQNHANESMLYLLDHNGTIITGLSTTGLESPVQFLQADEFAAIKNYAENKEYAQARKEYYKLFIVREKAFAGLKTTTLNLGGFSLSVEKSYQVLHDENQSSYSDIVKSSKDADELKASIFGVLMAESMKQDSLFLYKEMKKGNIMIYPQTPMFIAVKFVPISFFENMISKVNKTEGA